MKKKLINLLLTLCMAFAVIGFIGCKDEEKPATPQSLAVVGDSSVSVNDFSLDDYKLTVTMSDGTTQEITLSSTYLSESDLALLKTIGEHTVTITYQGITVRHTFTLSTNDFKGITFADKTVTYDGNAHSLELVGVPSFATVNYDKETSYTNAGTYTVKATVTADNYNALELSATLTIEKKELTVAFSGATNLTYTGEVQKTISVEATNLVDGDSVQITLTYSGEMIEKGDYTVTASIDEQNYKLIQNNTVQVKISRAVHTLTFKQESFADKTLTVDNLEDITARIPEPQKVTGYDIVWVWGENDYTKVTDSWTITAQKTAIKYTVTYINSGTSVENITTYTVEDEDILLNIPNNDKGVTFIGWYDENDELIESIDTAIARDITITAKWDIYRIEKATDFTIDYTPTQPTISITLPNAETVLTLDDKITVSRGCALELYIPTVSAANRQTTNDLYDLQEEENTGYLVVRHPSGKTLTYALTVYRQAIRSYTFMNGESTHHSGTVEETYTVNAPETEPTKTAYTFSHWSVNGEKISFPYTITEDTAFTAEYTPIEYMITLELAGGSLAETTLKYNIETELLNFPVPTKQHYDFVEWQCDGEKIEEISVGSYGEKVFTAIWTPHIYTVSYHFAGDIEIEQPVTGVHIEQQFPIALNPRRAYKNNAVFDGWYLDEDFTIPATQLTEAKDTIIYAKWIQATAGLTYSGGSVTGYTGTSAEVIIAECYNGAIVRKIGDRAFYGISHLTKIEMQNSINAIGVSAFAFCYNLMDITISDYVLSIEDSTFEYCKNLTSITIPNNTYKIGTYAFTDCTNLREITIGSRVTSIGYDAFQFCDNLAEVHITDLSAWFSIQFSTDGANPLYYAKNLYLNGDLVTKLVVPSNITKIGSYTFAGCTSITSVEIHEDVTNITTNAFEDCDNLTNISIKGINQNYESYDGILYNKGKTEFLYIPKGISGTITIPSSIDTIKEYAFSYCSNLTGVNLHKDILLIERYAFSHCTNLNNIHLPTGIETIGDFVFWKCTSLATIYIPDSVVSLGVSVFYDCKNLTSVVFGENSQLTSIGGCVFYGCRSLASIEIPDGITSIGDSAFEGCSSLTSIAVPDGITSINHYTFYGCSSLMSIEMPDGTTSIGEQAFYDCDSLTSITIPDGVTSIGKSAFVGCYQLVEIINKSSLTVMVGDSSNGYVGYYAKQVITDKADSKITQENDYIFYNDSGTYYLMGYQGTETDLVLPTQIQGQNQSYKIYQYAFDKCSSLTSIVIPDSVTSIGSSAFYYCSSLTSVTIGNSVTSIGQFAFSYCSSLTSIVIPDSVTSIGRAAFYNCYGLTSITFMDTSTWYCTTYSSYTGGAQISVTNPTQHVSKFTHGYDKYWYKN